MESSVIQSPKFTAYYAANFRNITLVYRVAARGKSRRRAPPPEVRDFTDIQNVDS